MTLRRPDDPAAARSPGSALEITGAPTDPFRRRNLRTTPRPTCGGLVCGQTVDNLEPVPILVDRCR